jgi:hypothetical protein
VGANCDQQKQQQQQHKHDQKTSKKGIRNEEHMETNKYTAAIQINLLDFASRMMLLYTLSRGLSAGLPMGWDLTKSGTLPGWSASILR